MTEENRNTPQRVLKRLLNFSDPESILIDRTTTESIHQIAKNALAYFKATSGSDQIDAPIAIRVCKEAFISGEFPLSEITEAVDAMSGIQVSKLILTFLEDWLLERQDIYQHRSLSYIPQQKTIDWEKRAGEMQKDFSGAFAKAEVTEDVIASSVRDMINDPDPKVKADGVKLYIKLTGADKINDVVADKYKSDARESARGLREMIKRTTGKGAEADAQDRSSSSAYRKRQLQIQAAMAAQDPPPFAEEVTDASPIQETPAPKKQAKKIDNDCGAGFPLTVF